MIPQIFPYLTGEDKDGGKEWLRSEQWHFLLKVRQDGASHQSALPGFNTPVWQQWQMPNKAHHSGNLCAKTFTKTARRAAKAGRGEKMDMKKPLLFYAY